MEMVLSGLLFLVSICIVKNRIKSCHSTCDKCLEKRICSQRKLHVCE